MVVQYFRLNYSGELQFLYCEIPIHLKIFNFEMEHFKGDVLNPCNVNGYFSIVLKKTICFSRYENLVKSLIYRGEVEKRENYLFILRSAAFFSLFHSQKLKLQVSWTKPVETTTRAQPTGLNPFTLSFLSLKKLSWCVAPWNENYDLCFTRFSRHIYNQLHWH